MHCCAGVQGQRPRPFVPGPAPMSSRNRPSERCYSVLAGCVLLVTLPHYSVLLSGRSMKCLAPCLFLLAAWVHPAHGQFQQAPDAPFANASLSTLPAARAVLPSPVQMPFFVHQGSLGLTPYLTGLQAPSANDEFPAAVPALSAPFVTAPSTRPIDTYPVRPSSVGGWLLRGVVETVCANATDNSSWGAAQCSSIGRRAYGYPRFRSTRYE